MTSAYLISELAPTGKFDMGGREGVWLYLESERRTIAANVGTKFYDGMLVGVDAEGAAGPHLTLEPQTLVDIDGPLGRFTFPDNPDEQRFVFIAGGGCVTCMPSSATLLSALNGRSPTSIS